MGETMHFHRVVEEANLLAFPQRRHHLRLPEREVVPAKLLRDGARLWRGALARGEGGRARHGGGRRL